jgi:hypothetical protein
MTGAFIFITLGVLILMHNLFPAQFGFDRTWPVILIVIGLVKIAEHIGRSGPGGTSEPGRRGDGERAGSRRMDDTMTHDADRERTGSDG